jgi:hypothetical protein
MSTEDIDYVSGGGQGQEAFNWPIDTNFTNFNVPAIKNPYELAAQTTLIGDNYDDFSAEALLQFKNLYKPEELNSIVDSYIEQTGDKETGAILKNLFGSDTTLSDTAIANAGKIPVGEGDITAAGYTTNQLNKIGSDAVKTDTTKTDTTKKTGLETLPDYLKYLSMLAAAKLAYDDAQRARKEARGATAGGGYAEQVIRTPSGSKKIKKAAMGGGIGSLDMARGGRALPPRYLKGHSDGMADKVPAHIDGKRPAALSDGEFVIPADVVSHLGNGNSNAGAKRLYEMMDRIRAARTGNRKQGKQINPNKFMPR